MHDAIPNSRLCNTIKTKALNPSGNLLAKANLLANSKQVSFGIATYQQSQYTSSICPLYITEKMSTHVFDM